MRIVCSLVLLAVSSGWLSAERVFWKAKGMVTDVIGPGFQALVAADELVDVEFSYDDAAVGTGQTVISPFFGTFNFRQNIGLEMQVTIGGATWAGALSSGPSGTPYVFEVTDVVNFFGTPERVSPILSSRFGEVFSSFPGASATGENELQVIYQDGQSFYDAVDGGLAFTPPDEEVVLGGVLFTPCEFTFGSGEIRAGIEKVSYVIDLATLTVGDGSPPPAAAKIDLSITLAGPEVQLNWGATPDKCYRIQSSPDLQNWTNVIGVVAQSSNESYAFIPPVASSSLYFRVVQLD